MRNRTVSHASREQRASVLPVQSSLFGSGERSVQAWGCRGRWSWAYLGIGQQRVVLLGEVAARLVVVDALGLVALLQLLANDASLHRAHPRLADLLLSLRERLCVRPKYPSFNI